MLLFCLRQIFEMRNFKQYSSLQFLEWFLRHKSELVVTVKQRQCWPLDMARVQPLLGFPLLGHHLHTGFHCCFSALTDIALRSLNGRSFRNSQTGRPAYSGRVVVHMHKLVNLPGTLPGKYQASDVACKHVGWPPRWGTAMTQEVTWWCCSNT